MYLELNNKKFSIDNSLNGTFEPKISHLRKKNHIEIYISLYVKIEQKESEDLNFFKNLKNLPEWIYFTNNYYWWIFRVKDLKNILVVENKDYQQLVSNFFNSPTKYQKKYKVTISFEYTEVCGTNNRVTFDRELLLKGIL